MSHPFGHDHDALRSFANPGRRVLRRAPRYRWTLTDWLLFAIPLAGVILAAAGRMAGWP